MRATDEINWDDLRYLRSALEAGTLAGAARDLGVEHSTVGRRLTALERAQGAPLLVRFSDGIKPTRLAEQLAPIVAELERAVWSIRNLAVASASRVRLAVPTSFSAVLGPHLVTFRDHHPDVSLEVLSGGQPVDLESGEADLALRIGEIADPDLIARRVGEVGLSLYASASYLARKGAPGDVTHLVGHELIGYDAVLAGTPPARWIAAHAAESKVVFRSRIMTDLLSAAADGMGLALLPCALADDDPRLRRLTSRVLCRHKLSLVYRRELLISSEVREVITFVVATMKAHAHRLTGATTARP